MAIDTPARLAILGAGPIGLEAALYARFLGYGVVIFERGEVAESIRHRAADPMPTPFKHNRTTLGLAAIQAQDETWQAPSDDSILKYQEWQTRYLLPLAATDLLSDHLRLHSTVTAIEPGRPHAPREADDPDDDAYIVHATSQSGEQATEPFAGILDCTGLTHNPNWLVNEDVAQYFHVLGSKAVGHGNFDLTSGYEQIRAAFAIIGDRPTLDLYASAVRLIR
jgi:glycine/D-amino acid oxidase-like deaminating enzyme